MTNRPGIKKIIENWKVVLLSLIGATTFWFFNALNKEYSARVDYPIDFVLTRDSVVIMDPLPETIAIDVSGGGWGLFRNTLWFSVDPIRVQLDNPTDIRFLTRSTLLPIVKDHLSDLNVNFLYSDTLYINIEKKSVKKVRLLIDSANVNLRDNHQIVSEVQIVPPTVNISGPETIIRSLQEAYYLSLRKRNIDDDVDETIDIPLPFEDIMNASPSEVTVSFDVDRFERKQMIIPLERINFPEDSTFSLSDTTITITYIIQRSLDRDFIYSDFGISLDLNMLDADSLIQPLIIYYPEEISELDVSPSKIRLFRE
jgi:YbbR domain-containing protein